MPAAQQTASQVTSLISAHTTERAAKHHADAQPYVKLGRMTAELEIALEYLLRSDAGSHYVSHLMTRLSLTQK